MRVLPALAVVLTACLARAESPEDRAPRASLVAGFERYGRVGEVDASTSGRILLTELSCTACHRHESERLQPKRGPRLAGLRDRAHRSWVRAFLLDPQAAKPGTVMPSMLHGMDPESRAEVVESLLAYLGQSRAVFPELKASGGNPVPHEFWNKGDAVRGEAMYHETGCVACHAPMNETAESQAPPTALEQLVEQLDADELAEMGLAAALRPAPSIPLPDLYRKYQARGLNFFLMDPHSTRPGGRMPDFQFGPVDAAHVTAYLRQATRVGENGLTADDAWPEVVDPRQVAEGQRWYRQLGCAACHEEKVETASDIPSLADLEFEHPRSCLAESGEPGLPWFALDAQQRKHLQAAVPGRAPRDDQVVSEAAEQMLRFNCLACHEREGLGGVGLKRRQFFHSAGEIDLGDEGRLPPPLDHVGSKLTPQWLNKFVAQGASIRPYLKIRMPAFRRFEDAKDSNSIPQLLRAADASSKPSSDESTFSTAEERLQRRLGEAGRELFDNGCVQCHPIRDEHLPGVAGIELTDLGNRIEPQWFLEFLRDPAAMKPRTRMPTFFPDGRSSNPEVLDGDVSLQIAALWTYLNHSQKFPLPQKILDGKAYDFELVPKERPIVLRTFMKGVGPLAVAVGFPKGTHVAFDAQNARLARAWKGRFLDAHGTWFDRFVPPAAPLGEVLEGLPEDAAFARLERADSAWPEESPEKRGYRFRGYRLDEHGVPTFLYRVGGLSVEDRLDSPAPGVLDRTLVLTANGDEPKNWWLRFLTGKRLKQTGPQTWSNEEGLRVTVRNPESLEAVRVVGEPDKETEARAPLPSPTPATIRLRYEW